MKIAIYSISSFPISDSNFSLTTNLLPDCQYYSNFSSKICNFFSKTSLSVVGDYRVARRSSTGSQAGVGRTSRGRRAASSSRRARGRSDSACSSPPRRRKTRDSGGSSPESCTAASSTPTAIAIGATACSTTVLATDAEVRCCAMYILRLVLTSC